MSEEVFLIRNVEPDKIEAAYAQIEAELRGLLPDGVEIHHIGSTSIPGSLTKGDLDVCVRTTASAFPACEAVLARHYPRNTGSVLTESFASFTNASVGIQLVAAGSELDGFLAFQNALRTNPELLAAYNALKVSYNGQPMAVYREAKAAFVENALTQQNTSETSPTEKSATEENGNH